jgi:hypothetical protein
MRNPIHKVLSTIASHNVRCLLMGGQACVLYGAAEFSRDTDLALFASPENVASLTNALRELHARRIAVPPFALHYLLRATQFISAAIILTHLIFASTSCPPCEV